MTAPFLASETPALSSDVRPWGAWFVLDEGPGYKVKRIEVEPGHRLSYQTHAHRAEHWTVVQGQAVCVLDGVRTVAEAGSSITVGLGTAHRICNESLHEKLVIIEVQLGIYTEEDDNFRLEDDYARQDLT